MMWSLTLIPWRGGGYGLPQPLLSGGMLESGVGVGAGVGVAMGGVGMGVVPVAGVPPQAASAMSAPAAQKRAMEGLSLTYSSLHSDPKIGALEA
jgi:hypothetical protein